jgi:hypothetical protein
LSLPVFVFPFYGAFAFAFAFASNKKALSFPAWKAGVSRVKPPAGRGVDEFAGEA